jgi:hypothetical protein
MEIEWKFHRDLQEIHEMIKGLSAGEHGKELIRRGKNLPTNGSQDVQS